jgi:hypothetical protein
MKYLKKQPSEGEGWFNTTYNLWLEVQEQHTQLNKLIMSVGHVILSMPWDIPGTT